MFLFFFFGLTGYVWVIRPCGLAIQTLVHNKIIYLEILNCIVNIDSDNNFQYCKLYFKKKLIIILDFETSLLTVHTY